jgi:hypothetical protein
MLTKPDLIGQIVAVLVKLAGATARYMDTDAPSAEKGHVIWRGNCALGKLCCRTSFNRSSFGLSVMSVGQDSLLMLRRSEGIIDPSSDPI